MTAEKAIVTSSRLTTINMGIRKRRAARQGIAVWYQIFTENCIYIS
jgi:hypothetical protein